MKRLTISVSTFMQINLSLQFLTNCLGLFYIFFFLKSRDLFNGYIITSIEKIHFAFKAVRCQIHTFSFNYYTRLYTYDTYLFI